MSNTNFLDVSPLSSLTNKPESLPTNPVCLQKAIEIVQKAIDADVKQEYEEAYKQ
jgi:hypothetical protein